jgi:ribonuclease HII
VTFAERPLSELRRRFARPGASASRAEIEALSSDPRAGARALAGALERRRERHARESRRLTRLSRAEQEARLAGAECIAGVDEVGVGPLAGPVVAAAVTLPADSRLVGLNDSKRLSAKQRERLDAEIREVATALAIAWATHEEIDRINVYQAGLLAMRRAVLALEAPPDAVFVDARSIPGLALPQHPVKGGDARVACVAAASIVAKVYRDAWMRDLGRRHPGYGFEHNAGYGTSQHLAALRERGPTPVHRFSFAPVREAAEWRRARRRGSRAGGRASPTS